MELQLLVPGDGVTGAKAVKLIESSAVNGAWLILAIRRYVSTGITNMMKSLASNCCSPGLLSAAARKSSKSFGWAAQREGEGGLQRSYRFHLHALRS